MKRLLDIVLALVGLLVSAPLLALIALAIRIDSPGRTIFAQDRLGKNGEVFRIFKFRKFPDTWGDKGSGVTVAGDARMTRVGRFLERTKLDELPQLWNILKGDMSFVGPRPESLRFAELFKGEFARVHEFKPGIFGPNQVAFRNESLMYPSDRDPDAYYREHLFPTKAWADIQYFDRANLFTDIGWIIKGICSSLTGVVNWRQLAVTRLPRMALDIVVIELAWLGANLIRFDGWPPDHHIGSLVTGAWLIPCVLIPVKLVSGCYRQPLRRFSMRSATRLIASSIVGWVLAYLILLGFFHRNASIMLAPLSFLLTLPLMIGPRLLVREHWRRQANGSVKDTRTSVIIYGAGRRGEALAQLLQQGFPGVTVAGFIDDNEFELRGHEIQGLSVLGTERDLDTIHAVHEFDQLWTTFEPESHKYHRLERWCSKNDVRLVVLPTAQPFEPLNYADDSRGQ